MKTYVYNSNVNNENCRYSVAWKRVKSIE